VQPAFEYVVIITGLFLATLGLAAIGEPVRNAARRHLARIARARMSQRSR
jgi:hypothetical protein